MKIPKTMSTQHPDNVTIPFFSHSTEISGEDEVQEAYYSFSHLGCDEQMWDCEGKEVDTYVVKKLLTKYESFFKTNVIGKDLFITLRVPNPSEERAEAKILLETLESIPRSFDAAKLFYGREIAPIFEVILPMTESADALNRIYNYYKDFVSGKENKTLGKNITISQWIGDFFPKTINVIPLFEDKNHMLNAHKITSEYLKDKNFEYQRVFLARSDPALNYGLVSAVLLNKIALQNLYKLQKEIGVPIYPILGVGSAPFRGNLNPDTVETILKEYPSVHTFTIQSAFKYDNHPEEVMKAVQTINNSSTYEPQTINEKMAIKIFEKYSREYKNQVTKLAPMINEVAKHIPSRRKRKLHVGLFGYSRSIGQITLPRAIKFTASLYSMGIPPSILALNALNKEDIAFLKEVYVNFERDLQDASKFFNINSPFVLDEIKDVVKNFGLDIKVDEEIVSLTSRISQSVIDNEDTFDLHKLILELSRFRKFLG